MKDKCVRCLPGGNCLRNTKQPFLEPVEAGSHGLQDVINCLSIIRVELLRRRALTTRDKIFVIRPLDSKRVAVLYMAVTPQFLCPPRHPAMSIFTNHINAGHIANFILSSRSLASKTYRYATTIVCPFTPGQKPLPSPSSTSSMSCGA